MIRGEAARKIALHSATALAVVLAIGAWIAVPALASHPESALQDIRVNDTATIPTLVADATTDSVVEELEEADTDADTVEPDAETPAVTTRLPGTSESSLPSYRRQMYRTDI